MLRTIRRPERRRCEHCGCSGIDKVRKPANARELACLIAFGACLVMPAMKYAKRTFDKLYCIRCRKRVNGDGVIPYDRENPSPMLVETIDVPVERETNAEAVWDAASSTCLVQ